MGESQNHRGITDAATRLTSPAFLSPGPKDRTRPTPKSKEARPAHSQTDLSLSKSHSITTLYPRVRRNPV